MKVCLLTGVYPPRIGGPATQTKQLAQMLSREGVETFVVTFGPSNDVLNDDGVRIHQLDPHEQPVVGPALQYGNALLRLRGIMAREKPDVVHMQTVGYLAVVTGLLLRTVARIPSVVKYAGDLVWETVVSSAPEHRWRDLTYDDIFTSSAKARWLTKIERFALGSYTRVWATSRFQVDSLVRLVGVRREKVVLMPNYVLLPSPSRAPRGDGPVTIATAARFTRWKRLDNTLRAFAQVRDTGARLQIVGGENPALERQLRTLARDLAIDDRVEFLGPLPSAEAMAVLDRADIFVSSTEYEPFGIVFVEAMALGLPIVATCVGGVPDVVPDGDAGFLVAPGDVDGMAVRLRELITDDGLRKRMGAQARERAQQFDLRRNIHRMVGFYEDLTASGGRDA